jgi:hypothetical protein
LADCLGIDEGFAHESKEPGAGPVSFVLGAHNEGTELRQGYQMCSQGKTFSKFAAAAH